MTGDYRYFQVEDCPPVPGRKTLIYKIISKTSGESLGTIEWYGPWRQFCVFPRNSTVWSAGCLTDLQDFFKRLAAERAAKVVRLTQP